MTYRIDIQHATQNKPPVRDNKLKLWAKTTLAHLRPAGEITIRLVDEDEMILLNHSYRQQNKATNVLAFPQQIPVTIPMACPLLGDVIICPEVLANEASEQALEAHCAHIVIHGVLHLLGYDHIEDEDAQIMEAQEIILLAQFGYDNPYLEDKNGK